MSMENLGPYTNFHELNQDWFLQEFNKLIAQWEAMQKSFDNLQDAFNDLKKYVQDYFKNLNVQEEINNKLNSMIADGSLITIISPTIRNSTSEWLNTHITNPSSPPIDTSLSVTKAAPDSKITGNYADKFAISCSFDKLDVNYVHDDNNITFTVDCGNNGLLYGKHKFFRASVINGKSAVFKLFSSYNGHTFLITLNTNTLNLEAYTIDQFIPITNVIFYVFSIDGDFDIIDIVYTAYKKADKTLSVSNINADARTTGNYADKFAISCSFDKLDINYVHDDNSITFTVDCGNSGILYGKHKFFIASAINRKSAVFNINSSFLGDTFFITLNANTLKLEVYSISGFIPITNVIFYVFSIDSDFNIIDIVYNPYKEKINYIYPTLGTETLSIFNKIVCCGDSYTSGHISTPTSTTSENEEYAWPKYLSNLTGSTCINCGKSGANVIDWQTTDRGLPKAKKSGVAQCYILGLGLNDYSDSTRHVDLGTTNDIGTDANTYYGGYSKIIRELHAISPKSIIFCLTMPFVNNSNIGYNNAIEYIANSYKNIYNTKLINLNKYIDYYKYSIVDNNAVGGHYSPAGYQLLAKILCIALSDYINTHPKEFYDVNLIPYDK